MCTERRLRKGHVPQGRGRGVRAVDGQEVVVARAPGVD